MSDAEKLLAAASDGDAGTVRRLLDGGNANVNCRDKHGGTPLMYACECGSEEAVRTLLAAKADATLTDAQGQTALHCAARNGEATVVAALLDAGANRDAATDVGKLQSVPLHFAAQGNHLDAIKVLVERGANVWAKDSLGRMPHELAVAKAVKQFLEEN